jgi:hypothetical protein
LFLQYKGNGIPDGGVATRVTREGFQGTRLSTTRYTLYGKFSISLKAAKPAGIVTTFITMSDRGDEIDMEILNYRPSTPVTTNIFYKRILDFGVRDSVDPLPNSAQDVGDKFYSKHKKIVLPFLFWTC